MKKLILSIVAAAVAFPVVAGGLMTNTNQSAAFLRSIARGTTLDPDAVHHNPAGTVFMADGWHFGISNQMAYQTRSTMSTFDEFKKGAANNDADTKEFKGDVFSPLIPSFHLTWKKNRWAVMVGMGVHGGGGEIEYDNGLASFERQFSILPTSISQMGQAYDLSADKYAMNMYLKGKSMTFAFNVGAAFRITDWLSIAAQLRFSSASNSYNGYMKNISVNPKCAAFEGMNGTMIPAKQFFNIIKQAVPTLAEAATKYADLTSDHILDVKQKGTSWSPVIALSFHKGAWDASVKYDFKMSTELEIESAKVSAEDPIINGIFPNGAKVKAETPALLAIAASRQYGPVKVTAEWHHYFDKDAENSFSQAIKGNTNEYLVGAEWQICKKLLVSAGVQRTSYNLYEQYYSDLNFSTSSWSTGLGVAYNFTEKIRLNLGFMKTFYEDVTNKGIDYSLADKVTPIGKFTDIYSRTSTSWSIGLDFYFGKNK